MELSWMKTFVTVAEVGSFRKTSEIMFVSQPTVTVHIKSLEKELGIKLLERTNRHVKLTEEGRRYLKHAKKLLATYREGVEEVQSYAQGYRKKLHLAISPLIADTIMPFVLKRYIRNNPEVEIEVDIMESVDIEEAVLNERVDIGFTLIRSNHSELSCTSLYEDEVVFCVPHDGYDSESAPPIDAEQLLKENYLLTQNHPVYWNSLFRELTSRYPFIKSMKVSQTHITKRFIVNGLGVSFLPKSTIRRELLEGRMLEMDFPDLTLPNVHTFALLKYNHSTEEDFVRFVSEHEFR